MRRGEIKIEGLGKRYWFRSDAPEEDEQQEEEEDLDDDERASRGFNFFFGRRAEIWALRDLFCHIEPGDRVAVIGVNGSGKSTLIRILSRTLPPSEGTIEGAGNVVPFAALDGPISTQRSGCDNLRMLARLLGLPLERLEKRLPEIVEFSELGPLAHEKVHRYSKRSFIRLSMAMALCMDADIYLIDDGLSFPDPIYREKVKTKFRETLDRNRTLVFASNNLEELRQYCRRALWLEGGKLIADGAFDVIAERYLTHRQQLPKTPPAPDTAAGVDVTLEPGDQLPMPGPQGTIVIDHRRRELKRVK